jgi:hypothetical protein
MRDWCNIKGWSQWTTQKHNCNNQFDITGFDQSGTNLCAPRFWRYKIESRQFRNACTSMLWWTYMHRDHRQSNGRQMIWECVQQHAPRKLRAPWFFVTEVKANMGASKYRWFRNACTSMLRWTYMHSDRMQSDGRQMIWDCVQERRNYMHHIFFVTKLNANVGARK